MSEKAINDGQWNPWRLLQDAEFIIRDLSPDHDFPGRIRMAREAHDKAIAGGTDPETAAEERGRRRGLEEAVQVARAAWHEHIEIDRGQIPASAIMDALDRHVASLAPRHSGKGEA